MRRGSPFLARMVFAGALALACVVGVCRADSGLLGDGEFATVGSDGSPWATSDGARCSSRDLRLMLAGDNGFSLVWQDLPVDRLAAGSLLTCAVSAELSRLSAGRGTWLSVQFHDKFERPIGTASSGTLSEPGRSVGLSVRTIVPAGVARTSFVLVVNGNGDAAFAGPSASVSALPAGRLPEAVTVRSGRVVGPWRGIGLSVTVLSLPSDADWGGLSPALWRITVPWGPPGATPPADALAALDSLIPRIVEGRSDCGVELVLTGGSAANFADELRCATSVNALAEHVVALGPRTRPAAVWVSLLDGPDVSGLLTVADYERCADASAQQLRAGVSMAGPEEWGGALWTTLLGQERVRRGGLATAVIAVPRRDLPLAAGTVTERVLAGAQAGVLRVFSDHPDEVAYASSEDHAYDLAAVLVRAADAGLALPILDLESGLPRPWARVLTHALPSGGTVRRAVVEPDGALDALWVTGGRGATRGVMVVNRGIYALPLEMDEPQWGRQTRISKTTLSASDGVRRGAPALLARWGKLVDLCAGRSVAVYSVP